MTAVRVATRDYARIKDGEVEQYRGDLNQQAIRYSREVSFWPWSSRSSASLATGTINLDNRDGRYDQLIFLDMRDQRVSVKIPTRLRFVQFVANGEEFVADGDLYFVRYVPVGINPETPDINALTAIVDSTDAPDDRSVIVTLKDPLTLLDVPIQSEVFGDDADEPVQDTPLPITFGVARSIRPPLWEAFPSDSGPAYRIHDSTLSGVANVRDKGLALDPLVDPAQYELDARIGNAGIVLDAEPIGVLTCDASSSGDAQVPVSPTDALDDDGQFDASFTTNDPDGWAFATGGAGTQQVAYDSAFNAAFFDAGSTQEGRVALTSASAVLEAGKTYRWTIEVFRRVQYATIVGGVLASSGAFRMTATTNQTLQDAVSPTNGTNVFVRSTTSANNVTGVFTGTYTAPDAGDRYVQLACVNGGNVIIGRISFIELPPPPVDTLEGIKLVDFAEEVVRRAGLPDGVIVSETFDAIDDNEAMIGLYIDRPTTALAAIRAPLDSYTADIYSDREGRFRAVRLRDVSAETPVLTIDANNLDRPPRVTLDRAEGLTTSMTAKRNYYVFSESDFVDNFTDVPLDLRAKLTAPAQITRKADVTLPTLYQHALSADPLISVYDEAADAAAEIQRVGELYEQLRYRIECDIWLDVDRFVEIGDVVELKYPRYGFDQGIKGMVYAVTDEISGQTAQRICRVAIWA